MPLPLLPLLLLGGAALLAGAAIVATVWWDDIVSWFQSHEWIKESDPNNIEYSIVQRLDNGNYAVQYGIFNTYSEEVVDRECLESETIDSQLARIHANNEVVVYE